MTILKDRLRRFVRGVQRAGRYPILLPHHKLDATGLEVMGLGRRELTPPQVRALELCDGRWTARHVARQTGVPRSWLVQLQEHDLLIMWRGYVPVDAPHVPTSATTIIVSPHPDDAALSCAGAILGGFDNLVVNVFSRTAWWRFPLGEGDVEKLQACRAMEEALVSRLSGAAVMNLDLPEALLRGHTIEDVFTGTHNDRDRQAGAAIEQVVREIAATHPAAHWFLPLGVGNHLDHRLAREASLSSLHSAGVKWIHFYEDLPYAAKLAPQADFSALLPNTKWRRHVCRIDRLLDLKVELLKAYWSQFTRGSLEELRRYARAVGGEVVWDPIA